MTDVVVIGAGQAASGMFPRYSLKKLPFQAAAGASVAKASKRVAGGRP